ncbi:hypothetical protein, partial [Granulicella sp. S190]|uniref:hypothetical protein n=1 Tax=Granulicella sp. S190 TaxID=1747226 RepID=UPI001C2065F2
MTPEDLDTFRLAKAGYDTNQDNGDEINKRLKTKVNPTTHMYTHCEIHPSMLLGICASIIPFPDHNQVCHSFPSLFPISLLMYCYTVAQKHVPVGYGQTSHG